MMKNFRKQNLGKMKMYQLGILENNNNVTREIQVYTKEKEIEIINENWNHNNVTVALVFAFITRLIIAIL